jgi:hypothetical protein
MAYAAHEATMRKPDERGFAQRDHLRGLVRRGMATEAQRRLLAGPPFPDLLAYLWDWFMELDRARTIGMNGPDLLTYQVIDAWARLTGREPWPHEVAALISLDLVTRHPEAVRDA